MPDKNTNAPQPAETSAPTPPPPAGTLDQWAWLNACLPQQNVGELPLGQFSTAVGSQAPINETMNPNATSSSDVAEAAQPVAIQDSSGI